MGGLRLAGDGDGYAAQVIDGIRMPTAVELRKVEDLLPYAKNSRTHTPGSTESLVRMIQRFGWTNPVLVAEGGIVAGHGRILAAKKLGLTRVPCIDVSHLGEDDRRALVIADNRSSELSSWSLEELKIETDYLRDVGFDLEADVGFSEADLSELLSDLSEEPEKPAGDPDDAPGLPDEPVSVPGDVWVIGEHRICCGSSLDARDWDRLMDGEQGDAAWIDPPFNVNQGRKNRELDKRDGGQRAKTGAIENDNMAHEEFREFLQHAFESLFEQLKPGSPIYVAHPDMESITFQTAFRDAGFKQQSLIVWNKNNFVLGRFDHQPRTESLIYGWKPGAAHKWYGGRKVSNVVDLGDDSPFTQMADGRWQVKVGDDVLIIDGPVKIERHPSNMIHEPKPAKSALHPTMKPTNLIARQLRNSTRRGDIVIDAFGGSGSTAVAAEMLGLKARLMELSPSYVDVAVQRLQSYTGLRAVHATTGEEFPEDGATRQVAQAVQHQRDGVDHDVF